MKFLLSSVLCLLSFLTFSQNLTQTIRGKITDVVSKSELAGVQVMVYKDSAKITGAQTDAYGVYRLLNVPIGRVMLKANYIGYESKILNIEITSAKEVILN